MGVGVHQAPCMSVEPEGGFLSGPLPGVENDGCDMP